MASKLIHKPAFSYISRMMGMIDSVAFIEIGYAIVKQLDACACVHINVHKQVNIRRCIFVDRYL
tara:strand:- start:250 stop:441 length:192 start_codon:yes stop_codon:yes gene_type:complete